MGLRLSYKFVLLFLFISSFIFAQAISEAPRYESRNLIPENADRGTFIINYDNENVSALGLTDGGSFIAAARFLNDDITGLVGNKLQFVRVYIHDVPESLQVLVFEENADGQPGNLVGNATFHSNDIVENSWNTFYLDEPYQYNGGNLWVGYEVVMGFDSYPAGIDNGPANSEGQYIFFGEWTNLNYYGIDVNWNIRAGFGDGETNFDIPSNPVPANNSTNLPLTGNVASWDGPEGVFLNKVYFSTDFNAVANNSDDAFVGLFPGPDSQIPLPNLEYGTTYFWRVQAWLPTGGWVDSPVWNFSTITLPDSSFATVQIIHNSPDVELESVDIFINGELAVPDFNFRDATPYLELPAFQPLLLGLQPSGMNSYAPMIEATVIFEANQIYSVIAEGVFSEQDYLPNPDQKNTFFSLNIKTPVEFFVADEDVAFYVHHGSTDAPAVDVVVNEAATLVENLSFGNTTEYITVTPDEYKLDVFASPAQGSPVASYIADVSGLGGQSAVIFASGFLNPAANQNGEAFGLFVALENGTVIELPSANNNVDPGPFAVTAPDSMVYYNQNMTGISLPLKVGDLTGKEVIAYQFELSYDSSLLTATGISTGSTISGQDNWSVLANTNQPGKIVVGAFGPQPLEGFGDLLFIDFEFTGQDGVSPLTFSNFILNSGNPEISTVNGQLMIMEGLCGDANNDGFVFAQDAALTLQFSLGLAELTDVGVSNADVDMVNGVTAFDAALILRNTIGLDLPVPTCFDAGVTAENPETGGFITLDLDNVNTFNGDQIFMYKINGLPDNLLALEFELGGVMDNYSVGMTIDGDGYVSNKNFANGNYKMALINGEEILSEELTLIVTVPNGASVPEVTMTNIRVNGNDYQGEVTSVGSTGIETVTSYDLVGAYPNPFNPSTKIVFTLPEAGITRLEIFDILGRKISTLLSEEASKGQYELEWNGRNDFGASVASGMYIVRLQSGDFVKSMKINLLK